jgi:hypothetical protein
MKRISKRRGPEPEILRIEGIDWKDAVKKSLEKKPPLEGWPKPESKRKKKD